MNELEGDFFDLEPFLNHPEECVCDIPSPHFDAEAAKGMTADEVREKFPRSYGQCSKCGATGVAYASFEHYLAGDW